MWILKRIGNKKPLNIKGLQFILSGWQDSNLRPPAPKAGAMTGLRYTPKKVCANITLNHFPANHVWA
jgi:hypothetical protein